MGLKVKGAITWDRAIDYAVSSTYSVEGRPNKQKAHCKICGIELAAGEGLAGSIREVIGSRCVSCYWCRDCADTIKTHVAQWAGFQTRRDLERRDNGDHDQI